MINCNVFSVMVLVIVVQLTNVNGHGMILDPPGRSSMWRVGFSTPANYNDNALFCGGFSVFRNSKVCIAGGKIRVLACCTLDSFVKRSNITILIKDDVESAVTFGAILVLEPTMKAAFTVLEQLGEPTREEV